MRAYRKAIIGLLISSYAIKYMDIIDYVIILKGKDAFNMLVASGQEKYEKLYSSTVGSYMKHVGQIFDHNAPLIWK